MKTLVTKDKVTSLLVSLDKYQLNRFRKFLISPYFNENKDLVSFFDAMDSAVRRSLEKVTRESIWKKTYGNKKFQEQKYRRLASDLTKLINRFISVEWHERESFHAEIGVMKAMNSISMQKHFSSALREARKKIENQPYYNIEHYYYKYIVEYENHLHEESLNARKITLESLTKADHNLDLFYIINKLKHYCDALNYKTILSVDIDIRLLPHFFDYIEENNLLELPVVNIYYQIYHTVAVPEKEEHYHNLTELLDKHHKLFKKPELRSMYIYATNYCINKINGGKTKYYRDLYDLYMILLERETIFNTAGELSERHYKNIVALGAKLQEYDLVEDFIRDYSPRLAKEKRENAMAFNLAEVYFSKKEYDKAMEQLRYVNAGGDYFYAIGIKVLMLKIYYETDAFSLFNSLIDSFSLYLRRNTLISKDLKRSYLSLLKYLRKIYNTPDYKKDEMKKLLEEVQTSRIQNHHWVISKIKEKLEK